MLVDQLWNKFSAWSKLQSIVAWCLRFISNAGKDKISIPFLLTIELKKSHDIIIKIVQKTTFTKEIVDLENAKVLKDSTLISLNPFLDNCSLLRVGGRLENASLPETGKFSIILPKHHSFLVNFIILSSYTQVYN